jgi:hypothetical protein
MTDRMKVPNPMKRSIPLAMSLVACILRPITQPMIFAFVTTMRFLRISCWIALPQCLDPRLHLLVGRARRKS